MKCSDIRFIVNASESSVFKTYDTIDGEILFTPHHDTDIDDITISFQGMLVYIKLQHDMNLHNK
jgi:hypothetical protein